MLNPSFREQGKFSAVDPSGDIDPWVQAHLDSADAGGVSPDLAEIALGLRDQYPRKDVPFAPRPIFKPARTGHVRGETGTPSGRDIGNAIVEASQLDPAARPFDFRVREAFATKSEPKPLRKYLQRSRELLRSFGKTTFLDFHPLSKTELHGAEAIMTQAEGNGALSTKQLFNLLQGSPQGVSKRTWEVVRRERAENAVSGRLNKWGDFVQDSQIKIELLTRLQTALDQGLNTTITDVLRRATAHPESYKRAFAAVKALVQYLDLKELSGTGPMDIPFDPLRESKSDGSTPREGAKKRITDAYAGIENSQKIAVYVLDRVEHIDSEIAKRAVANAIDMHMRRESYWKTRLREAFEGTSYQGLGSGVFAVVGIEEPK